MRRTLELRIGTVTKVTTFRAKAGLMAFGWDSVKRKLQISHGYITIDSFALSLVKKYQASVPKNTIILKSGVEYRADLMGEECSGQAHWWKERQNASSEEADLEACEELEEENRVRWEKRRITEKRSKHGYAV